jgi:hypothetical protein
MSSRNQIADLNKLDLEASQNLPYDNMLLFVEHDESVDNICDANRALNRMRKR